MKNKNVSILGGCMIAQTGILPKNLFHQLLKKRLEQDLGSKINIKLQAYHEFIDLTGKIGPWMEQHLNDQIIIQYRPEFLLRRLKLFIRSSTDSHSKLILNPSIKIATPENIYNKMYSSAGDNKKSNYFTNDIIEPLSLKQRTILSLNVIIGQIFLGKKAKRSFERFFMELDQLALHYEGNIYFIGFIPTPCIFFNIPVINRFNRYFKKYPFKKLIYVDVFSDLAKDIKMNYTINKYHINEKGHQIIANDIFENIKS